MIQDVGDPLLDTPKIERFFPVVREIHPQQRKIFAPRRGLFPTGYRLLLVERRVLIGVHGLTTTREVITE